MCYVLFSGHMHGCWTFQVQYMYINICLSCKQSYMVKVLTVPVKKLDMVGPNY